MSPNSCSRDRHINIPNCIYTVCFLCTLPVERNRPVWEKLVRDGKPRVMSGGVIRTCWRQEGSGSWKRITTKILFSLFGCSPMCAQYQSLTLFVSCQYFFWGEVQFLLARNSVFVHRCVYRRPLRRRFNPVMLNSGLKTVPLTRKHGKGAISSLQGCHVKKAKQGFLFSSLPFSLYFLYITLSVYSAYLFSICSFCSLIFSAAHTHTQSNPETQVFPELASGCRAAGAPVTCCPLTVITALCFVLCHPGGQIWQRNSHAQTHTHSKRLWH